MFKRNPKALRYFVLIALINLWCSLVLLSPTLTSGLASATTLGDTAAMMKPGTWAIVPMQNINLTAQAWDTQTGGPGPGYDGTQPGWNSKKKELYLQFAEHGRASSDDWNGSWPNYPTGNWKPLLTYTDSNSTWSGSVLPDISSPFPSPNGTTPVVGVHNWNFIAWDDVNEVLYVRSPGYTGPFYRYCRNSTPSYCSTQANSFRQIASPTLSSSNLFEPITYDPTYNGGTLIFWNGYGNNQECGALFGYKEGVGWTTIDAGTGCKFSQPGGGDLGLAVASPPKKVTVFGGGTNSQKFWKLDSQTGVITQLDNAPCGMGMTDGIFTAISYDPVTGNIIAIGCTHAGQLWELNPTAASGSQWTLIDGDLSGAGEICNINRHPTNNCSFDFMAIPISTYGVIGYWKFRTGVSGGVGPSQQAAEFWVYKHAAGTPPPQDTTPPTVSISSPIAGSTVSGSVTLSAAASDNIGLVGVQFKLDGNNLGAEDTSSPFSVSWDTTLFASGNHTLTAIARDAAGNSMTSTPVTVSVSNSVSSVPPPPTGSDFQTRCAQTGVLRCVGFDQGSDISNTQWGANTGIDTNGTSIPVLDSSVKASGNSSLQFTVPSNSAANSSGAYWANFSTDLSTQFGENSDFYIQWRQRFSPEFLSNRYAGGLGWKQQMIGTGDKPGCTPSTSAGGNCYSSCTDLEIVNTNLYYRGFPQMYQGCPGNNVDLMESFGSYDYKLQNARTSPYCLYSASNAGTQFPPTGNCFPFVANEWMTFQIHVHVGPRVNDRFTNSLIQLWVAREGQPSELVIDFPYSLYAGPAVDDQKYGKIWFTPYNTSKDPNQSYPVAYTWYDELIISRTKIPDPGGSVPPPSTTQPPVAPTGLTLK